MIKYKVIIDYPGALETKVNYMLEIGWRPQGGVQVLPETDYEIERGLGYRVCQAMVLESHDDPRMNEIKDRSERSRRIIAEIANEAAIDSRIALMACGTIAHMATLSDEQRADLVELGKEKARELGLLDE